MSGSSNPECPFCSIPAERVLDQNDLAVAIADAFPVALGHTLIIPRRHTPDFFDLNREELIAVLDLLSRVRERLQDQLQPAGYNIGTNVGVAAGQTIMHVHMHLIPRYCADVLDPTGGVRNVIPGKGRYSLRQ